jgi:hypothetical protein
MTVAPLHQASIGRFRWWLKLIAITTLLSFLFTYFLLVPVLERLVDGAFRAVGTFAQFAQEMQQFVRLRHDAVCRQVESNEEVVTLLGLPIVCAPLEAVEWIEPRDGPALEFAFDVRGPRAVGRAHARFEERQGNIELRSLIVTVDGHVIFLPSGTSTSQ